MNVNFASFNLFIEKVISWPTLSSGELTACILFMFYTLFLLMEIHFPKQFLSARQWRESFRTNIALFVFNSITMSILSAVSLLFFIENYATGGLFAGVKNPYLKFGLALVAVDFMAYVWHRACHTYDGLWMFHKVHHSDPYFNVTTAFRVHIIELLVTVLLKVLAIVALGLDKITFLGIELMTTLFVMFHHTNFVFPGEKYLSGLFIVPSLHRVHHSTERKEHDQNLGAIWSIWDRLFGTFEYLEPKAIGILNNAPLDFFNQLKFGFTWGAYKPVQPLATNAVASEIQDMIAEGAYYKSKKRGFQGDCAINDWLEAEREILQQF